MAADDLVVRLDLASWKAVQKSLKRTAPEVQKELSKTVRKSIQVVVRSARSNASYSTRIPRAVTASVTTTRAAIRVNRKKAPHGRVLEGGRQSKSFRHPVYGNRDVWVTQRARPYLKTAVASHGAAFVREAEDAIDAAGMKAGWSSFGGRQGWER